MNSFFKGLFDTELTSVIEVSDFLLCIGVSLVLGILMALGYMYRTRYTKSFVTTLALLPAVVCVVIMMVNGNVGTGVAVAGAPVSQVLNRQQARTVLVSKASKARAICLYRVVRSK